MFIKQNTFFKQIIRQEIELCFAIKKMYQIWNEI